MKNQNFLKEADSKMIYIFNILKEELK